VVAARELNPDRLIDNQRDWINRHFCVHPRQLFSSHRLPMTVRGIATIPTRTAAIRILVRVVAANGSVISQGCIRWISRASTFGPTLLASTSDDYAIAARTARPRIRLRDQHRKPELHRTPARRRTGSQLAGAAFVRREVLRAKLRFPTRLAPDSKILFQRDPSERVNGRWAMLTPDTSVTRRS